MSKAVKIGYADYLDEDGNLTVLHRAELRAHVYRGVVKESLQY
jgi:hypothetical protein